jgi:hypothetical protein
MKTNSIFRPVFSLAYCLLETFFMLTAGQGFGQTYCTPFGVSCGSGKSMYCSNLSVGNYRNPNNSAGGLLTRYPIIPSCPANGYTDFRNAIIPTPTYPGSEFLVLGDIPSSLGTTSDIFSQGLWIDYNNDGIFNASNESVTLGSGQHTSTIGPFHLPTTGLTFGLLNCRLRTTINQTLSAGDACTSFPGLSHTIDFKINLIPYCFQPATCKLSGQGWSRANYFNLVNFSTGLDNVTYPSTYESEGYCDYRSKIARVPIGASFTVNGNIYRESPNNANRLAIWVDWNNDKDFNDAGELVGWQQFTDMNQTNLAFSQTITPPSSFASGNKTMRLASFDGEIIDACTFPPVSVYGETEDYTVSLMVPPGGTLSTANENLCSPANPGNITFSTLPSGSVYYNWYYKDGLVAQPTGTKTTGWTPIANNHPITGLPTMTSYDPPSGLISSRTYACFVTSRLIGSPPKGWAYGVRYVKVKNCTGRMALDVEPGQTVLEETEALSQNIPNPFTTETTIPCFIHEETKTASLEIFGLDGRKVQQINLSGAGKQDVLIQSKMLPASGMYLYTLVVDGQKQPMKRMVLVK